MRRTGTATNQIRAWSARDGGGTRNMARVPQIMVVDPDRDSIAEIQKMLGQLGFTVIASAGYGVEAFTLAHQLKPDLVLMRIEEPLVRPVQTLARLNDGMPDLPII